MKKIIFLIMIIPAVLWGDIEFFPGETFDTNPHSALLRASEVTVLFNHSYTNNKDYWEYHVGAKIPVLDYKEKLRVQTGGFGALFPRFELNSESFNYVHQDFLGGLYLDMQFADITLQTNIYHVSSHIGDDYMYYDNAQYENNGFEAIKQYASYRVKKICDITLGFEYKLGKRPEEKIFYNKSFFIGNFIDLFTLGVPLFFEWEVEIIDFTHKPNIGLKMGVYLNYLFNGLILGKNNGKGHHELSVYYYNGYAKLGYFYNKRETLVLAGPTYRF